MRKAVTLSVMILMLTMVPSFAKDKTPAELKASADAAKPSDCPKACMAYAKAAVELSNTAFEEGRVDEGHRLMVEAADYAKRAAVTSNDTRKHQKRTEIDLRKLSNRMRDIKNTLNFDDRAPIEKLMDSIELARDEVLLGMFGHPKKSLERQER